MTKLDITREHCPMTFVKAKLELEKLTPGDELEILLKEGEPLSNLPKSLEEQGYAVTSIQAVGGDIYRMVVKK